MSNGRTVGTLWTKERRESQTLPKGDTLRKIQAIIKQCGKHFDCLTCDTWKQCQRLWNHPPQGVVWRIKDIGYNLNREMQKPRDMED
jgi:hypothetical protein